MYCILLFTSFLPHCATLVQYVGLGTLLHCKQMGEPEAPTNNEKKIEKT